MRIKKYAHISYIVSTNPRSLVVSHLYCVLNILQRLDNANTLYRIHDTGSLKFQIGIVCEIQWIILLSSNRRNTFMDFKSFDDDNINAIP